MKTRAILLSLGIVAGTSTVPATAQAPETPYWAAIDVDELNMRVGPSVEYRIAWVYHRRGWPVKVLRTRQGWRYVEDADGTRGWFLGRMLTDTRYAVVTGDDPADIRAEPAGAAALKWQAEPGVVVRLGECEAGWCAVEIDGRNGFMKADRLWGDGPP